MRRGAQRVVRSNLSGFCLLRRYDGVFRRLGDPELHHSLGGDLDGFPSGGVASHLRLAIHAHQSPYPTGCGRQAEGAGPRRCLFISLAVRAACARYAAVGGRGLPQCPLAFALSYDGAGRGHLAATERRRRVQRSSAEAVKAEPRNSFSNSSRGVPCFVLLEPRRMTRNCSSVKSGRLFGSLCCCTFVRFLSLKCWQDLLLLQVNRRRPRSFKSLSTFVA